jgi:hemerythrin-like domain-containing protein
MQARGPLMIEHRLIERMIAVVKQALNQLATEGRVDPYFVDTVVDFIRMYADRTHHGKEEDILFSELDMKDLSAEDRRVMDELVQEHVFARKTTRELVEANTRYREGNPEVLAIVAARLNTLVEFYPQHIAKEDKVFFPAARAYMSEQEEQAMIAEFWEFDRKMIHEKYRGLVEAFETAHPRG